MAVAYTGHSLAALAQPVHTCTRAADGLPLAFLLAKSRILDREVHHWPKG